jgi:rhodanese-related sulfurtransferase
LSGRETASAPDEVSAEELRAWLHDDAELALLDVREPGQMAEGHILFSAPAPYSRFELDLPRLVPNPCVRTVLCDAGDGVAGRAARRARALGYAHVAVLAGGVAAWRRAGHTLFQGVNVPSKTFGELVEQACRTPHIGAAELGRLRAEGADIVVVDGRTRSEFGKMNVPGAHWCPNGELALRIGRLAPDPGTTVVVNCAGRTRSIIGAQTLIDLGLPNRVLALENGTQGWTLAGLPLGHGAEGTMPQADPDLGERRRAAQALARRDGVEAISGETLRAWLSDAERTVYLLDIRSAEEREDDPAGRRELLARHGVLHAPGGQLVQATDQWIGVRRARLVVLDIEELRAPVTAGWLRRMGHDAAVLAGGLDALDTVPPRGQLRRPRLPDPARIAPAELHERFGRGHVAILDLRASGAFRGGHIPGATWTIRPRIADPAPSDACVLVADAPEIAALAALDLAEAGRGEVLLLDGGFDAWQAAGLPVEATPNEPADAERIDFVAFTHGRHEGDFGASRQYLEWEIGLVGQLDAQERAVFRI